MDFKEIKQRLLKLDTACVCDADKTLKVMDPGIRPIRSGRKMIGLARTVQCRGDLLGVLTALHEAKKDEVLVVDAQGEGIAMAGELLTTEAYRKRMAGFVIDGGFRDVQHAREIDLPVYARHITPLAGTSILKSKTQMKISCGGVSVSPEEIIFGDDDGIIVMSHAKASLILKKAEDIQKTEEKMIENFKKGKNFFEMTNYSEHCEKIKKGEESELIFKP
jgi:regulator of RNase E activity RraA